MLTGGRVRRCGHTLEFWGGGLAPLLRKFPIVAGAAAVTFGHVVLAQGEDEMNECREHELVHVRQYERWGPIFIPAYLGCSVAMWLRGKDPYRDNPFEREAFEKAP